MLLIYLPSKCVFVCLNLKLISSFFFMLVYEFTIFQLLTIKLAIKRQVIMLIIQIEMYESQLLLLLLFKKTRFFLLISSLLMSHCKQQQQHLSAV